MLVSSVHYAGAAGSGRNRLSFEYPQAFMVSLQTSLHYTESDKAGEVYEIVCIPVVAVEASLFKFFFAGVSLPFTIRAGFPVYGAVDVDGEPGSVTGEFGSAGGYGAIGYRINGYFSFSGQGNHAAGGFVQLAAVCDPVALKASARLESRPDCYASRWIVKGGYFGLAVLTVLNEMISIELGIGADASRSCGNAVFRPSLPCNAAVYIQKERVTASICSTRDIWNPANSGSFTAGICFTWMMK